VFHKSSLFIDQQSNFELFKAAPAGMPMGLKIPAASSLMNILLLMYVCEVLLFFEEYHLLGYDAV
jgi:hypothetical protein